VLLCWLSVLTTAVPPLADGAEADGDKRGWDLFARVGTGTERASWNFAAGDGNPNVLSELHFRSATSIVGVLGARYVSPAWSIGGEVMYGGLTGGTVQDDDFAANNRQGLFSRSLSAVDGHYVLGLKASVDSALWRTERGEVWLLTAIRYHEQRFRLTNGVQVVPATGGFARPLNTMFDARWYGLEIGTRGTLRLWQTPFWLQASASWLPLVRYDARGWWNLRADFEQDPSFSQKAVGWGWSTDIGLAYRFSEQVQFGSGWRILQFQARDGTDTTFFSDGVAKSTKLNEAHASSSLFYFELTRHW
jgi:hypothetical protein